MKFLKNLFDSDNLVPLVIVIVGATLAAMFVTPWAAKQYANARAKLNNA